MLEMMDYAETGIRQLHELQRAAIAAAPAIAGAPAKR
jgi:hypothetical protein